MCFAARARKLPSSPTPKFSCINYLFPCPVMFAAGALLETKCFLFKGSHKYIPISFISRLLITPQNGYHPFLFSNIYPTQLIIRYTIFLSRFCMKSEFASFLPLVANWSRLINNNNNINLVNYARASGRVSAKSWGDHSKLHRKVRVIVWLIALAGPY